MKGSATGSIFKIEHDALVDSYIVHLVLDSPQLTEAETIVSECIYWNGLMFESLFQSLCCMLYARAVHVVLIDPIDRQTGGPMNVTKMLEDVQSSEKSTRVTLTCRFTLLNFI